MAGLGTMRCGFIKCWIAASLLSVLAGCATVAPPQSEPLPAPSSTIPSPPPRPSIAKRILEKLQKPFRAKDAALPSELPAESAVVDEKYQLTGEAARELERGHASWYGGQFHGRRTANGETYDKYALTAAHKTLPFGTIVRVRSLALGREVDVRINDRGPFAPGRVIDVSQAAAEALGLMGTGVAEVSLNVAESAYLQAEGPQQAQKTRKAGRRSKRSPPAAKRR
ncbi:MAG: septal ring lytic transglycosylase RlpA family protein [Polaromonas sp.]